MNVQSITVVGVANATVTAPLPAAGVGHRFRITHVSASFTPLAAAGVLLQIRKSTVAIWQAFVPASGLLVVNFTDAPLCGDEGVADAFLAAGGGTAVGVVNIVGYLE